MLTSCSILPVRREASTSSYDRSAAGGDLVAGSVASADSPLLWYHSGMNTRRIAVVTAANSDMCPLALDLVQSVKDCAPFEFQMICLDVGLDRKDQGAMERSGAKLVPVGWDYPGPFPGDWFKALTARPHIPRYVPGFDLYIWLDADCWVQEGSSLQRLVDAALEHPLAAASAVHRGYRQFVAPSPTAPGIPMTRYHAYLYSQLVKSSIASDLLQRPYLNGGVMAARGASPIWAAWQQLVGQLYPRARAAAPPPWQRIPNSNPNRLWKGGAQSPTFFHTEEVALNVAGHLEVGNPAILDARCNWLCSQAIPMINRQSVFVDTAWPHAPIGIVHMSADTKQGKWSARLVEGGSVEVELRRPVSGKVKPGEQL